MIVEQWPDLAEFNCKEAQIAGRMCYLYHPDGFPHWNKDNMIFRSSMWTETGGPVSLGFKKFFNLGENIELVPDPTNLNDAVAVEKIDGSLLIVSKYHGQLIIRTRGTIYAANLENGWEIEYLKKKYPAAFDNILLDTEGFSILYEWVTPNNKIVLDYPEPDIYLVGIVDHVTYRYAWQENLDYIAEQFGVKRPQTFYFATLEELVESVKALKGQEGVCIYYNDGQDIKKVKSLDYLAKHAFKSNISDSNMIDLFLALDYPTEKELYDHLNRTFDFEIAEFAKPYIEKLYKAYAIYRKVYSAAYDLYLANKHLSRKEYAIKMNEELQSYIRFMAFQFLDGRDINKLQVKKLLEYYGTKVL